MVPYDTALYALHESTVPCTFRMYGLLDFAFFGTFVIYLEYIQK